jgi:poly(ADP-ribose) glycohydrolase ARH3
MSSELRERVLGSLLGLALGDAFGAPYEGGPLERALWVAIGKSHGKRRWTDDTQMSLDLAGVLLEQCCVDQQVLARRFAQSYQWSRGYGPGTARVLARIRRGEPWEKACKAVYPSGSYGNGGAMRAPVAGLLFAGSAQAVVEAARQQAAVTHAHPLALEGAALIALATALALENAGTRLIHETLRQSTAASEFATRLAVAACWLEQSSPVPARQAARELGHGIAAHESCVTAIYLALAFRAAPFEEMHGYACQLGGDVDTIAAMAGAIWGATRGAGALPAAWLSQLEQLPRIEQLANHLADAMDARGATCSSVRTHALE